MDPDLVIWWLRLGLSASVAIPSIIINRHLFRIMRRKGARDGSQIGDAL
jgi:hypothetical protein